jgi:beta-lactamase regulating signal transducer with metallopeptidase domain
MQSFDRLADPAWRALTWTLLHFLWQGLLIAAVWHVLLRLVRTRRTQIHYVVGLAGLTLMAACPAATFLMLESDARRPEVRSAAAPPLATTAPEMPSDVLDLPTDADAISDVPAPDWSLARWEAEFDRRVGDAQPYLLGGWIVGLIFLSGRLLLGVLGVQWLRWRRLAVPDRWISRAAALARTMGFRKAPGIFASAAAREALVTGLWRPMVLLPAAWLADMTPEVLEAVLAHELAHIRRFDLWVNVFQRVVETLLFYHPAVWRLSRRVRLAREMCCDELAARATGDRAAYATALEQAARQRLAPARSFLEVALGVTQMTLLHRVRNVLGLAVRHEQGRWWPAAVLTLLAPAAIWLVCGAAATSADEKAPVKQSESAAVPAAAAEASPPAKAEGKYTATALLQVSMQDTPLEGGGAVEISRERFEIYKATQQRLLTSRFVLVAALRRPGVAKLASIRSAQASGDPVKWLAERLQVDFPGKAEIMEVNLGSDDPKEAAILVRAVVDAYTTQVVDVEQTRKRKRLDDIESLCDAKDREIREKHQTLRNLAALSEAGASDMERTLILEDLAASRHEVATAQSELRRAARELAGQKALLEDAKAEERPAIEKTIRRLQAEMAVGESQLKMMQDNYVKLAKVVSRTGRVSIDVERLQAEIKSLQTVESSLIVQREQLRFELHAAPRVTVLDLPEVPEK